VYDADQRQKQYREMARERRRLENAIRERSPLRLHAQIRSEISHGAVRPDQRLDEETLVRESSTSRNSVRAALSLLATEGIVTRTPRNGTIVVDRIEDVRLDSGGNWSDSEFNHHEAHQLGVSVIPTPKVIGAMLRIDAPTIRVDQWIDYDNSVPACVYIKYTAVDGPQRPLMLGKSAEFDEVFLRTYGSPLDRIDCTIQAVSSDERTARLLEIAPGSAMLLKERLLWDASGVPRELSHTYYIASRASLSTTTYAVTRETTAAADAAFPDPYALPVTRDPGVDVRAAS
jgi:DNA-binding GntR family transcriptional regulator